MKKWGAILLFSVYAIGSTELDQLIRVPLLVKHFIRHKEENSSITIAAFIKMHYIDEQPFDADYAQDMELPFKKADCHCIILPTVLPDPIVAGFHTLAPLRPGYPSFIGGNIPVSEHIGIFKPPRI
jgi:hypothetical protein